MYLDNIKNNELHIEKRLNISESEFAKLTDERDKLATERDELKRQLAELKRLIFGSKSERFIPVDKSQLALSLNPQKD